MRYTDSETVFIIWGTQRVTRLNYSRNGNSCGDCPHVYTDCKIWAFSQGGESLLFQLAHVHGWQVRQAREEHSCCTQFQLADVHGLPAWSSVVGSPGISDFNSRMYTDGKGTWHKFQTLSGPVLPFSRTSCKRPVLREYTRYFAQIRVSCWTYFLPGFYRAVPVISTPALLSLGISKRTRLCCYPIL